MESLLDATLMINALFCPREIGGREMVTNVLKTASLNQFRRDNYLRFGADVATLIVESCQFLAYLTSFYNLQV